MGNEQDSRIDIGNVGSKLHDNKKVTDERPQPYLDVRRVGGTREIRLRELEREQAEKEVRELVALEREDEKRRELERKAEKRREAKESRAQECYRHTAARKSRTRAAVEDDMPLPERVEERNPHLALRQEVQQQLHRVVDRLNEINDEAEGLTRQLEEIEARVAAARQLETNN